MSIIQFLEAYGYLMLCGLSIIIEVIILVAKKRPKTLDDFLEVILHVKEVIPTLISEVERPGDGIQKKSEVIDSSLSLAVKLLGRPLSDTESKLFLSSINEYIEKILSTPQKKEI